MLRQKLKKSLYGTEFDISKSQKKEDTKVQFFNKNIGYFVKMLDTIKANEYFDQMRLEGVKPDLTTYRLMLQLYQKQGNVYKIERLYEEMLENGVEPDHFAYRKILETIATTGEVEKVKQYFELMKEHSSLADDKLNQTYYSLLIETHSKMYNWDGVVSVLEEMKQKRAIPSLPLYISILNSCAHHRKYDVAVQTWKEMLGDSPLQLVAEEAMVAMIRVCIRCNRLGAGFELMRRHVARKGIVEVKTWMIFLSALKEKNVMPKETRELIHKYSLRANNGNEPLTKKEHNEFVRHLNQAKEHFDRANEGIDLLLEKNQDIITKK